MKEFIRKHKLIIIFMIAGMAGGLVYWKFVGCLTGSCPIKSVWYWSTLFGGLIGYLLGSIVNDLIVKLRKKKNSDV
jgi:fructose-specific phosphotransferase system IIC component